MQYALLYIYLKWKKNYFKKILWLMPKKKEKGRDDNL